jgi:tetratricopeptide (TPR) repeat protein
LEVRWLRGKPEAWTNLAVNQIWDIFQGDPQARPFTLQTSTTTARAAAPNVPVPVHLDKVGLLQFWAKQHAAMDAMKRERNFEKAATLFREALVLNPQHEDSHYYLANCLATLGDIPSAIAELDTLARINPANHRAYQRKGELLAASASSRAQLESAHAPLRTALLLNPEETGTLLLLGQVALAEGNFKEADQYFSHVCQANPRAANSWFLRGYIAWKQMNSRQASVMLATARDVRGREWKPPNSALEGDVQRRMYSEAGFLTIFEQHWDGSPAPDSAFGQLDSYLAHFDRKPRG